MSLLEQLTRRDAERVARTLDGLRSLAWELYELSTPSLRNPTVLPRNWLRKARVFSLSVVAFVERLLTELSEEVKEYE